MLAGDFDEERRRTAQREAHKLAGSVGTFGFAEGSALARNIELLLNDSRALDAEGVSRYHDLVSQLRAELEAPDHGGPDGATSGPPESILIVDVEPDLGRELQAVAIAHGAVGRLVSSAAARHRLAETRPELVIVDASSESRRAARGEMLRLIGAMEQHDTIHAGRGFQFVDQFPCPRRIPQQHAVGNIHTGHIVVVLTCKLSTKGMPAEHLL